MTILDTAELRRYINNVKCKTIVYQGSKISKRAMLNIITNHSRAAGSPRYPGNFVDAHLECEYTITITSLDD